MNVQLIGRALRLPDLIVIGSHCVGLDAIIDRLQAVGVSVKALNVGSMGGLAAAKRGQCDIAAIHLMDPATGAYNHPFLTETLDLVPGYRRLQGIVFRKGDRRFEERSVEAAVSVALGDLHVSRICSAGNPCLRRAAHRASRRSRGDPCPAHQLGIRPNRIRLVPKSRRDRPAVRRFVELLQDPAVRLALTALGFAPS